ncbi:serine hydrolase domain-containing protein [Paenibacillus tarimensis]|uniref:serine hydrolase domain-containing protein n=1 Tax=Paenibacillus tarimensis TaxID=416012 RepID=UPI001F3BCCF0|nr:serine hydrolase domain-containing protein [Paenibacillus tarimensis]MCF2945393.1 beta-lactamase family protein [Paenibacillus tarimensis]
MSLTTSKAQEAGMTVVGIENVDRTARRLVEEGITPAQVTFASRRGITVHHAAYGTLTPAPDSPPLELDSLFPLCSITKVVTAASIMLLVEEGRVGLNRPVADYIPEFTGEGKHEIRVHHLLTHTSGIRPEDVYPHIDSKKGTAAIPPCPPGQDPETHEHLSLGFDVPAAVKPGTVMYYLGFGYELLGEIIRRVTGQTHDQFAAERLFKPLGMNDTYYSVPESEWHRIVQRSPEAPCAEWINEELVRSASASGGIYSTARDLAVFAQMFLNKGIYEGARILSPVSVIDMTRNHIPGVPAEYRDEVFAEASWGYGWAINGSKRDGGDLFSPEAYNHWGAAGVFVSVDPVYETVQVYLSVELDHQKPFKNIYADLYNNTVLAAIADL